MIYALDANIVIYYLRENESVKNMVQQAILNKASFVIPRAVDYEVRRGLEMISATRKVKLYDNFISPPLGMCKIVDMGEEVWETAKKIYIALRRKGFTVGEIDILIGAFCLQNGYTLVTDNTKDFMNIEKLQIENWRI